MKFGKNAMGKRFRVFLDTSALLSGLNSPTGAAGVIIAACRTKEIIPVISAQIIEESQRNIARKFPKLETSFQAFLLLPPEITPDPTLEQIRRAYQILPTSDAPILAAALKAKPDVLVTWDVHDFFRKEVRDRALFLILLPGDFVTKFLR